LNAKNAPQGVTIHREFTGSMYAPHANAILASKSGLQILQFVARIDLLATDVDLLGGMNGRQVADVARVARPNLKVLFITGYAE